MKLCVIGAGRVGMNIAAYGRWLGAAVDVITRPLVEDQAEEAAQRIAASDVAAFATPDASIGALLERFTPLHGRTRCIHFSGALSFDGANGYHPLFSFPTTRLEPEVMSRIAFAVDPDAPRLGDILPGARNPTFVVPRSDRALYHALAVVSGNFAAHLWNEAADAFARRFPGDPAERLGPYFDSVVARFRERPLHSVTGPVARGDALTIHANLAALDSEPRLKALYEAYLVSAASRGEPSPAQHSPAQPTTAQPTTAKPLDAKP